MTPRAIEAKVRAVCEVAHRALSDHEGPGGDATGLVVAAWTEPDGTVVLHLVSGAAASVVTHALWNRHAVRLRSSPAGGVVLRVT